jgi:signal transduction histidine kinase/CheY-like chemotaxis protein/HPt (histidine-containing phosphotransfer) domain-containing protein
LSAVQKQFSIGKMTALVCATFMLPIAILCFFVVSNVNEFIHFARWETYGIAYQRPLEDLLRNVQDYQIAGECADQNRNARLQTAGVRIEKAITALQQVDARLGANLQFTDEGLGKRGRMYCRVDDLRNEWQNLSSAAQNSTVEGKLPQDVQDQYTRLVATIRTMITHAGDTSNLILDPDLDSYYLMDVTLLALPQTQDRLAQIVSLGLEILSRGELTRKDQTKLEVYAALLEEADLNRIIASAQTSLNEDSNFYGRSATLQERLPVALAAYENSTHDFISLIRQTADPNGRHIEPEAFEATGLKARADSFDLWNVAAEELDLLLAARIASYTNRRTVSLGLAGLAVLLAVALAYFAIRHAKDAAESASRSKSEFLANTSHEIRTPLNSILGFTELLRRGDRFSGQDRAHLDAISSSGRHLLSLINDILDLSKIEAGRFEFERIRCSPHQIISEVLSTLRVPAQERGHSLECRWASGVPETILTDPARLRQVLTNLVGNAIKFTERGRIKVVATVAPDSPEPRFLIEVHDTGIGIPADRIDAIFSPFEQADNSITRRFGGTGLGLAISRRIVDGLGGELTVESEPGRGSVFRVTLSTGPLENVRILDSPPTEALKSASASNSTPAIRLSSARILLVEDGPSNRQLIGLVLQQAGAEVTFAENGQEGLDVAGSRAFDLILMDMQMPVLDGYTAAKRLRERGCHLPIIALTAHAMRGDKEKCLAAGCTGYLSKPIDMDELVQTVAAALREAVAKDESSRHEANDPWVAERVSTGSLPAITSTLPTNDPEFARITEIFIDTLHSRFAEMQAAYENADLKQLAELAHWLKGTGGTVGFNCFTEPARRLELLAKQDQTEHIDEVVRELGTLIQRITVSVKRHETDRHPATEELACPKKR